MGSENVHVIKWECAACGLHLEMTTDKNADAILAEITSDHAFFRPDCQSTHVEIECDTPQLTVANNANGSRQTRRAVLPRVSYFG